MLAYSRAAMLVRTWNVNRGNASPPDARNHLHEMVTLMSQGGPDLIMLQDVPAWGLEAVGAWAGMKALAVRAERPRVGVVAAPAGLAKLLSAPHSGRLQAAFGGRGNVILIPRDAKVRNVKTLTLNTNIFCEEKGPELGLNPKQVRRWQRDRRICHLVQYELPSRQRVLAATLHATSHVADLRLADAELQRALHFVERRAEVEEIVIVAGDFNIARAESQTIKELEGRPSETRWDVKGAHVDHVLVRNGYAATARVWTREERTHAGRVLSNHYPIEIEVPLPVRAVPAAASA
jgi:endonuclease/exonuclease/phosphatase family metal-dependent hydrolase